MSRTGKFEEEYEQVLKSLEGVIVPYYGRDERLSDHTVMRVLEAVVVHYKAVVTGRLPKPPVLSGLELEMFDAVRQAADGWLEGAASPNPARKSRAALRVEELFECAKRLHKSVEFWNRSGGRRGYYDFVHQFLPDRSS